MSTGKGAPGMNPPLVNVPQVTGDKTELIKIILNGYKQPTKINGELYQNVMPSHAFLSDQQIADVLTFIRKSWGNTSDVVSVELVTETRAKNK